MKWRQKVREIILTGNSQNLGRVLLKVINQNVDVNVDVDVNPFRYFYKQNSRKLRLRQRLDLRPLVKLGPALWEIVCLFGNSENS